MTTSTTQNSPNADLTTLGIGPPPSAGTGGKGIGLPKGYTPPSTQGAMYPIQTPAPEGAVLPAGDKYNSVGGAYNEMQYTATDAWSPGTDLNGIKQLQAEMIAAGVATASSIRPGTWDQASANAYAKVLKFANQNAMNATDALSYLVSNPPLSKTTASATQPIISFANPVDVAADFDKTSQDLTGQEQGGLLPQFQQQYTAQEAASQHLRGQNYVQAPSATASAAQYLEQKDPSQVQAYGAASAMQTFFNMLGQK